MAEKSQPKVSNPGYQNNDWTLTWHQLEAWRQQDNAFVIRGYRPLCRSYTQCLESVLRIHNETINIYTHLLGIPLFLISGYYLWCSLVTKYISPSYTDAIAFGSFFAGVVLCLSLSVNFHIFASHSKDVHDRFLLFDFMGILSLIMGSWIPGIFYGFYCQPTASQIYWTMICTITTGCALVITIPHCRTPAWKPFRTTMFISLGLSGILPMTYAATRFGVRQAHLQMGWGYIVLEGIFYLSGALIYASKIPERWQPGKFDVVGASHQWFHFLVLMGAGAHLTGIVTAFHHNHHPDTRICEHFWGGVGF